MKNAELFFIPFTGISHLGSTVEIAKLLADRDERLSISVLIMKYPNDTKVSDFIKSLSTSSRIKFIELKKPEILSSEEFSTLSRFKFIESHKDLMRDYLARITTSESVKLCGVVVDLFCISMIDLANEFEVPSYAFFTSGAAVIGLHFYAQRLNDNFGKNLAEFAVSETELSFPSYKNPVPYKVVPSVTLNKDGVGDAILEIGRKFRETKGIIINTFLELESHAIESLSKDETIPPVYTGGPLLGLNNSENPETGKILKWLDLHPDKSVVFLCFGSMGYFDEPQIKEIAYALEGSGHRFLWSLRKKPAKGNVTSAGEDENLEAVLPEGFLQRTAGVGMVIGWAPQAAVLAHSAVGGFVSHCGWNSVLESIWFGVPVATWPLYAEQEMNAFQLVKDLGLAVEIKMDYKKDIMDQNAMEIVTADVIEEKIRTLMDPENEIRKRVNYMKEKSRLALEKGGSSSVSLQSFIDGVIKGLP